MEKFENEKKEKLDTRDLITIGIFNAIISVVFYSIGLLSYLFGPMGTLFAPGIASIVNGIVFILLSLKVRKKGVFFITGIIQGLLRMSMSFAWWLLIAHTVGGLIADMIASRSKYNNKRDLALGYCIFQWFDALASWSVIYLFTDYVAQLLVNLGYYSTLQDALNTFAIYTIKSLPLVIIPSIIGPILGAYIGVKINIKHFEKAGMI